MFPLYLAMGMTEHQFWHESPYLAAAYRKADEIRRKRLNESQWLQGMYIYDAFSVVLANAFKKKGASAVKYPEQPYPIFPKTEQEKEEEKKREQQRIHDHLERMRVNWAQTHPKQIE